MPAMSKATVAIAYAVVVVMAVAVYAAAQPISPAAAPSPGLDCFPYLLNMSDCLSFVENGSTARKPEKGCCPELGKLVNTQPLCLCQLLGNPMQIGIPIDIKKALKLPAVCNVTTPPVSLCAAIGYPVGGLAPARAPSQAPSAVPVGAPGPGPSGFPSDGGLIAASPSPGGKDKGSAANLASNSHFLIGLAAVVLFTYLF